MPSWVPAHIRPLVDGDELAVSTPALEHELSSLSTILNVHVAAYRHDAVGRRLGLCALYEAASLSDAQLAKLQEAEARWPAVWLVAYAAPLRARRL